MIEYIPKMSGLQELVIYLGGEGGYPIMNSDNKTVYYNEIVIFPAFSIYYPTLQ